ncbi:MAG TPA: hypothetical protein DIT67_10905 [Octadecabacter sp.]|nr:hypothetical protein [Octadecabacter sp.]
MGRPRSYNRAEIVEKAVILFRQNGYKAVSIGNIVEATGMNTASMYKEFGDKNGLFVEALNLYRGYLESTRAQLLIDQPNISGIEQFLKSVVEEASGDAYHGCLIMNHLTQKNLISHEAEEIIGAFCEGLEALLESALKNARAQGEIPAEKDPASLAKFFACLVHGFILYGRHENKKNGFSAVYETAMEVLH